MEASQEQNMTTVLQEPTFQMFHGYVAFTRIIDGERKKDGASFISPLTYQEPVTREKAEADLRELWESIKHKYDSPEDVVFKLGEEFRDTWVEGWFSHWTYRMGRTDEEILSSFDNYVTRIEAANWRAKHRGEQERCLMGAEDRWRWRGSKEGSPAPCRCEHCEKGGIARIDH